MSTGQTIIKETPWFIHPDISEPLAQLNYAIKHQPRLRLRQRLCLDSPVLKLQCLRAFLSLSERGPLTFTFHRDEIDRIVDQEQKAKMLNLRDMFTTAEDAAKAGENIRRILAGKYIAEPWSWEDSHCFWGESDRVCDTLKWIFTWRAA